MKQLKSTLLLVFFMAILLAFLTGCLDKEKIRAIYKPEETQALPKTEQDADAPKTVILQGSVTALPLMRLLTEALSAEFTIDMTAVGKESSIAAVQAGEADLAIFEGALSELPDPSNAQVIARESICLIVNKQCEAQDITTDQIVALFTDEDNMLADQPMNIVIPSKDLLARQLFEDMFEIKGEVNGRMQSMIPDTAQEMESEAEVISAVAADPSFIGVISTASLDDSVKVLSIDGFLPDAEEYGAKRDVLILCRDKEADASKAILDFIYSPKAKDSLSANGYSSGADTYP